MSKIPYKNLRYIYKTIKTILISIIATYFLFLLIHQYLDKTDSVDFFFNNAKSLYNLREVVLDILFRVAPFIVTIIIAITSLIINAYTGSFFAYLLREFEIKFLIIISFCFFTYHLLTIFTIPSPINHDELIEHLAILSFDLFFSFITLLVIIITCIHIFLYTSPSVLKNKLKKEIMFYLNKLQKNIGITSTNLKNDSKVLNQNISWFTNLLKNAVQSRDYHTIDSILMDLKEIWINLVVQNSIEKELDDKKFKERIKKIKTEDDIEQFNEEQMKIFEDALEKLSSVYIDSFEFGLIKDEYYICEKIIVQLLEISTEENLLLEDIEQIFNVYIRLFNVIIQTKDNNKSYEILYLLLKKLEKIYEFDKYEIKDFNVYYKLLYGCIRHSDVKKLNLVLDSFRVVFKNSIERQLYKDTVIQIHRLIIQTLKFKEMKCFASLIRFCITRRLKLDIFNEVFTEKLHQDFLSMDLLLLLNLRNNNHREDTYLNLKAYFIFYSYYLLQKRISPDRILDEYLRNNLGLNGLKNRIPFDRVRTLLLDLETYIIYWDKLFVNQASYYFTRAADILVDKKCIKKNIKKELRVSGNNSLLKELNKIV